MLGGTDQKIRELAKHKKVTLQDIAALDTFDNYGTRGAVRLNATETIKKILDSFKADANKRDALTDLKFYECFSFY